MNNEDMSEMIQKLSSMINNSNNSNSENNNSDISSDSNETSFENLQGILANMNFNSNNNENNNNTQSSNNNFNFDFETIMKMKSIMDSFNSAKNSPEANLLLSLKPYLNNNRKQKLDQYIQFLNLSKVIEAFNSNGGVNNKWYLKIKEKLNLKFSF